MKTFSANRRASGAATLFIAAILALLPCGTASGYGLEQVRFADGAGVPVPTWCTGNNDSGYVCGYTTFGVSGTAGFVVTPHGITLRILPGMLPGGTGAWSAVKAVDINNQGVVLLEATDNTAVTHAYKAYVDMVEEKVASLVAVGGIGDVGVRPTGINDNNDIVGWWHNTATAERWMWIKHDSVSISGIPDYKKYRYSVGSTNYTTQGFGINGTHAVGYYVDGSGSTTQFKAFRFLMSTEAFFIPGSTFATQVRPMAISETGQMVGEYKRTSSVLGAWSGAVSSGALTATNLEFLFQSTSIQSIASNINAKGEIVGSFVHPVTGQFTGFIYRPAVAEYRIPGFSFKDHTWSLANSGGAVTDTAEVWTPRYYQHFRYKALDPYAPGALVPMHDAVVESHYPSRITPTFFAPSWRAFGYEVDSLRLAQSAPWYYQFIAKHSFIAKYYGMGDGPTTPFAGGFRGVCWGFVYTTLMRYFDDAAFSTALDLPSGLALPSVPNTDTFAILALERVQLRQQDRELRRSTIPTENRLAPEAHPWLGLYRLKSEFMKPFDRSNPMGMCIGPDADFGHIVLPYKVRTPQTLPFDGAVPAYDTVFVADSNVPSDSTVFIRVPAGIVNGTAVGARHFKPGTGTDILLTLTYQCPPVRSLFDLSWTTFKTAKATADAGLSGPSEMSMPTGMAYTLTSGGGARQSAWNASAGYSSNDTTVDGVIPVERHAGKPAYFYLDSTVTYALKTEAYADSAFVVQQSAGAVSMGLSRPAIPSETDYAGLSRGVISYGTHDAAPKTLAAWATETGPDPASGVHLSVTGLGVATDDSILFRRKDAFVYEIVKIGGGPSTYSVTCAVANADSGGHFSVPAVTITGGATHTIDPYFGGASGGVAVLIDNGSDGVVDDTVILSEGAGLTAMGAPRHWAQVYPNPAGEEIFVALSAPLRHTLFVDVADAAGRRLTPQSIRLPAGATRAAVPLAGLPPGLYVLSIRDALGRELQREKVVHR